MERLELNIPTIYSHSTFQNSRKEVKRLSSTHLNYFYSLIYLYREKILEDYPNILVKGENSKHTINEEIFKEIDYIEINLTDIEKLIKGSHKSKFENLQEFIRCLKTLYIKTNVLNKNKTTNSKVYPITKKLHFSNDKLDINVIFTEEFIRPFILIQDYFKKFSLNHLFNLKGCNDKLLYLVLKDYDNHKKDIPKDDLTLFIGKSFNFSRFHSLIKNINENTDINVSYLTDKKRKNPKYKFDIKSQKKFVTEEEQFDYAVYKLIWNEVEKRVQNLKEEKENDIDDLDKYKKGIYKNIKKNENDKYESMVRIDQFIEEMVNVSKVNKKSNNSLLLFNLGEFNNEIDNIEGYTINDNYQLQSYPYPVKLNYSIEDTYSILDKYFKEIGEVPFDGRDLHKKSSF